MEELSDDLFYCPKRKNYFYRNDHLFIQFAFFDKEPSYLRGDREPNYYYANIGGNVITYALATVGNKLGTVSRVSTKVTPLLHYDDWDQNIKDALTVDWQGNQNIPLIITRINTAVDKSNRRN